MWNYLTNLFGSSDNNEVNGTRATSQELSELEQDVIEFVVTKVIGRPRANVSEVIKDDEFGSEAGAIEAYADFKRFGYRGEHFFDIRLTNHLQTDRRFVLESDEFRANFDDAYVETINYLIELQCDHTDRNHITNDNRQDVPPQPNQRHLSGVSHYQKNEANNQNDSENKAPNATLSKSYLSK